MATLHSRLICPLQEYQAWEPSCCSADRLRPGVAYLGMFCLASEVALKQGAIVESIVPALSKSSGFDFIVQFTLLEPNLPPSSYKRLAAPFSQGHFDPWQAGEPLFETDDGAVMDGYFNDGLPRYPEKLAGFIPLLVKQAQSQ